MDGRPVWLASYSLRRRGRLVATGRYSDQQRKRAIAVLSRELGEVGDNSRMRVFRMNVTVCIHKALTDEEVAALVPAWCNGRGIDIAGGPVEVVYETIPGAPSTRPCVNPERGLIDRSRPDLWFPIDCGACEPCLARKAV